MITNCRIKNVALIDEAEVNFDAGLNLLTGETGAGKSMVIDAVNFMLGERPGKDFVRSGAESALVEGLFETDDDGVLAACRAFGVDIAEDGQILITRSLTAAGKSACRVNGKSVTVGMLKELSALLVDVHGQHEHQSLLNPNKHILLLDQFCGAELESQKQVLGELLQQYREVSKTLKSVQGGSGRQAQAEVWQYQIDEIAQAKLSPDEEDQLLQKRNRLNGVDKLAKNTDTALRLLYGGESNEVSASDMLARALGLLTEIGRLDETKQSLADRIADASMLVSDVAGELRVYAEELDADPNALEAIEARLDVIYRLKKKYGATVADVLAHYDKLTAQMEQYLHSGETIKKLTAARRKLAVDINGVCGALSALRKTHADQIKAQIVAVLRDLGMRHAQFDIAVEKKNEFSANGYDHVEFMISPNLGEALKPLSKIASGGEMSRVMLAIKTVMADADHIETMIFDEIDTGVSGRTAQQVAEKLAKISQARQILCITHLPQIAAMADRHFLIEKKSNNEKTVTYVHELTPAAMTDELARLIGGAQITDATRKAAEEMKLQANQVKSVV